MQLDYNSTEAILSVKWADEISVESPLFFETIITLFKTIQEKKITKLIIDSGRPAGGVLTEEVINHFIQHIPVTPLKYIALLESTDYLWDQNLLQVIKLLVDNYKIGVRIKLLKSKAAAEEWLAGKLVVSEK